jgi:hypothetical protein
MQTRLNMYRKMFQDYVFFFSSTKRGFRPRDIFHERKGRQQSISQLETSQFCNQQRELRFPKKDYDLQRNIVGIEI